MKRLIINKEISKCRECPHKKNQYGQGESFDYCSILPPYKGNIKDEEKILENCPLEEVE